MTAQTAPACTCAAATAEGPGSPAAPAALVSVAGFLAMLATMLLLDRHTDVADVWRILLAVAVGGVVSASLGTLHAALRRAG